MLGYCFLFETMKKSKFVNRSKISQSHFHVVYDRDSGILVKTEAQEEIFN